MKQLLYNLFYFIFDDKLDTLTAHEFKILIDEVQNSGLNLEMKKELLEYARRKADTLHRNNRNAAQKFFKMWGDLLEKEEKP